MFRTLLVLALCLAPAFPQSFPLTQQTCVADRRKTSVQTVGANVVLGGLFDIREPTSSGAGCGLPSKELMQVYEAARWTISQLNSRNYVPGVTFGLEAYDTCTLDSNAVRAIQEFYPQAAGRQGRSSAGLTYCTKSPSPYKLGMIGPMQSSSALLVGQMLPNIPASSVSMRTAIPELSNKNLYPTYLRTFPSVSVLARAASKLFKQLQWEKMVIVYADDAYGLGGYQEFLSALTNAGICVSGAISVPHKGSVAQYRAKLENIASFGATAALFYGNPTDAVTTLQALQFIQSLPNANSAAVRDLKWMFGQLDSAGDFSSYVSAAGALTALPTSPTLAGFRSYFTSLNVDSPPAENPWLQDWFMNTYQCRLPGVSYAPFSTMTPCTTNPNPRTSDYVQSAYVVPTVQSILAYAEAIKRVCSGSSGVCNALTTMNPISFHNNYLSDVDITFPSNFFIEELRGTRLAFDVNGDPLASDFIFYSYNSGAFTQIGDYTGSTLTLTTNPTFPRPSVPNLPVPSQCSTGACSNCLTPTSTLTLAYKAGDVVVAALVDSHEAGSNPLDCGAAIPDRLIDAVAVRYGADEATRTSGQGLSVGYLIVDVCPGLAAAESFLTNLMGGFKLYMDAAGNIITTNNIVAVLDMTEEDTAWRIAPILAATKLPQIRMASSSQMLLRNPGYPNLISALPSQETVQLSIVQMLYKLDLKYVQIISEASGSYYRAAESFRRLASRMNICVALWSTFGTDSASKTANRLRNVAGAPVVVVFGSTTRVRFLLDGIQAVTGGVASQRLLTLVSGSEEFGSSTSVSLGLSAALSGALFVRLDQIRNSGFDTWLSSRSQSQIVSDAFLAEWFEQRNDCSLTSSSRLRYDRVCSATATISSNTVYQGYAPYIIRGIASLLNYVNEIVDEACGTTVSNCVQFRNLVDLSDRIVNKLRNSNDNTQFEIENGEGMSDLTFVNFRSGAYADVGVFDTEKRGVRTMNTGSVVLGNGQSGDAARTQCAGRCGQCQYAYGYQEVGYLPGDWLLAGTFSVSDPGPDGQRPYVCGEARTSNGFQYTAAMMYALDRVNSGMSSVILKNVTLGGLIMDHCNNERRAYGQVSDIYSGLTELTWRNTMGESAPPFMATDILAWLTDTTASTREAAEMTQPLGVAIVSPSATAAGLTDNPTFFRTIQGDTTTATAIVKLCKTLGFSFLQVVHAANSYGQEGKATLTNVARAEGLCVINSFEMTQDSDASPAVAAMAGGTSRVVVLYLGTSLTTAFLQQAALQPVDQRLTILSTEPFSQVVRVEPNRFNLRNNLLSLRLQNPVISDFNDYLNEVQENSQRNPFFAKYYMKTFSCNLDGYYMYSNDCPTSLRITDISEFALSTINAVYSVAAALQATLVQLCGEDYVGQCPDFLAAPDAYTRFIDNLKAIQFQDPSSKQFRFLQREGNVVYDLLQFDGSNYQTIGTYGSASLSLTNSGALTATYSGVKSECSSTCSECIFNSLEFSHTPGDIYLGGVFDVHGLGQGVFDCGTINTEHGFQLLEAFHFALQQVNSDQGIFRNVLSGVTLGGVGLDACESAIRGGYLVSNINNGLTQLVKDGKEIKASDIDVYIGPYSSDSSIYLARILTDLQTPQISYAATSNTLENKFVYPYFFRTVPPDDKLVLGMLRYLDENNLRYVQLLFADSSYGRQGVAQFDLLIRAHNFSICVAQRVIFPERAIVSKESSDDVVFDLLKKPVANTVVIFAGSDHIRAFLQAVERSRQATATFKFVGPTTWGDRYEVTEDIRGVANDAVTFVLDFQGGVGGFLNSYLELRNPTNAGNNPWFEEWFQLILDCYTTPANAARYPRGCSPNVDLKSKVVEDNGNLHVINAVYSAAFAIHETLKMKCGDNYAAVCEAYRSSTDRRTIIRDQLEGVNFTDPTDTQFRFVDRAGNKGYKLFKLSSTPDAAVIYTREPIGEFSSDDALTLNMALTPKYDGSCERKDACVECPNIRNRGVRFAVGGDPNGATTLVGIFDVHDQGSELYQCSELNMEGFLKFLAFFWTYSQVAASSKVRLLALDTCSNSMRVGQDLYGILNDGKLCNSEFFNLDKLGLDNVGGVVVTGDENTAAASRLLEQLKVTYVSPDATSPLMDGNQYLLRSRTPWSGYMAILSQFLDNSGWSYVNTIYNNAGMGQEEYLAFQKISKDAGICLHSNLGLADDATDADITAALRQLDLSTGARAVVLFTKPAQTISILRLAQQLGIADNYLWIWANDSPQVIMDMIPAGASFQAVILQPKMYERDDFSQWVSNIQFDPQNTERNRVNIPRVWMEDFFQTMHRCKLSDAMYPLQFTAPCDPAKVKVNFNSSSDSAHYTHLASGFSMKGLEKFFEDCLSGETVTQCLRRKSASRQIIRDSILATTLNVDNTDFVFNKPMRYVQTDYEMYIIDVDNGGVTKNELYRSYSGGQFSSYNRILNKQSVCTSEDGCGCKLDNPFAGRQTGPSFKPTMPRNYYKYSKNNEQVYEWPIWAIVVAVLTCIGLLVTIITFLYLLFAYPIKGGTSVLGYLTMIGIMGIYAVNFAFFLHASDATCGARRFMMGVVYCIVFAALLVKAVDNWRFADMEYSNHQYRGLTNSVTLLLMALGIVLIQCIIPIEWLILVHPTATKWTVLTVHDYWWCDPHDFYDIGLVLSFIFVVFIVLLTAIFSALAWDSESNNRESRWILVSAIATAGCLMVWMIVTTNAGPVYRDPAVAIANFVNATLLLILIPLRKTVLLCQATDEKPDDFVDYDPYSNVYANQSFDPDVEDYNFPEGNKGEDDLTSN